ncbi:hypothetical protein V8E51_002329 [Hyaloscypha variabilis]
MSSNVPTAIDAALGGASFLSSLSTWMAFLALHAEPPSESMSKITEFISNILPRISLTLPNLPYNIYYALVLTLCIISIFTFCFTRMIITLRMGYNASSMAVPLMASCLVSFLAHLTLAEYLLVCLPTSVTSCELVGLAWMHCSSRRRRLARAPALVTEKRVVGDA